jgi:hypothetical protein
MIREMKRALVVPSAIVIYGALAFAWSCGGDEEDPDDMGGTQGGSASGNGGNGGAMGGDAAACTPGTTMFVAKVVDATTPSTVISGATVIVLDDDTGEPLVPENKGVSGADGKITLTVDKCKPFAVKAVGTPTHTDTYSYHVRLEASGRDDALFRMGSNTTSVLVPASAMYPVEQGRAPAAGAVYWKTDADLLYDVVGCAHVELSTGAIPADWALRYFAGNVPSSITEWPLEKGTRKTDGRFFVGNATPGKHTFVAKVNGTEIGRTDIVIFPRSQGSTKVPPDTGMPANLFLAGIYIDAPNGAKNPTPADCQP